MSLTVLKSIEVSNSAYPKNNGIIVSFVTFTVSGVDYHTVQYFRKDQWNRFRLADRFYVPFGTGQNEPDKMLEEGDPIAVELFAKYKSVRMPNLSLGPDEVAVLLSHIEKKSRAAPEEARKASVSAR